MKNLSIFLMLLCPFLAFGQQLDSLLDAAVEKQVENCKYHCMYSECVLLPVKRKVHQKKIEKDIELIRMLNDVFANLGDISVADFKEENERWITEVYEYKINKVFTSSDIYLSFDGNIDANVYFFHIGNEVIESLVKLHFYGKNDLVCKCEYEERQAYDFVGYLKEHIIAHLKFPLNKFTCYEFSPSFSGHKVVQETWDRIDQQMPFAEERKADSCRAMLFDWRMQSPVTAFDYDYRYYPFTCVQELIYNREISTLEDMLDSPNIGVRVYAAEALFFLEMGNVLKIKPELLKKIDLLYADEYEIVYQATCVQARRPISRMKESKTYQLRHHFQAYRKSD